MSSSGVIADGRTSSRRTASRSRSSCSGGSRSRGCGRGPVGSRRTARRRRRRRGVIMMSLSAACAASSTSSGRRSPGTISASTPDMATMPASSSGSALRPMFVATRPGMIDTTWIGSSSNSSRRLLQITLTACFVAPYTPESGSQRSDRRHVDDVAPVADRTHGRHRRLRAVEQRDDVDVEHRLPLIDVALEYAAEERDAGVVDQDVEVPVGVHRGARSSSSTAPGSRTSPTTTVARPPASVMRRRSPPSRPPSGRRGPRGRRPRPSVRRWRARCRSMPR